MITQAVTRKRNANLEAKLEKECCKYAEQQGWLHYKMNVIGQRGWPDRVFLKRKQLIMQNISKPIQTTQITFYGLSLYVEFKVKGKKPNKLQKHRLLQLEDAGVETAWIDDFNKFKRLLDSYDAEF